MNLTNLLLHTAGQSQSGFWSQLGDAALDGLTDGLWSIPILFIAYLLMELLERSRRFNEGILHGYSRKAGPALGGILGIVPQCGISGAAATLFSTGSITVGTMLAVFFATSCIPSAVVGVVIAVILAYFERSLLTVAFGSCAGVFLTEWILSLLGK